MVMDLPIIIKGYPSLEKRNSGIANDDGTVLGEVYNVNQLKNVVINALKEGLVQEKYHIAYFNALGTRMSVELAHKRLSKFITCKAYPSLRARIEGSLGDKVGTPIGTVNNIKDLEGAIETAREMHLISDDALVACYTYDGKKLRAQEARRFFTK